MAKKALGVDIAEFLRSDWPSGEYFDDFDETLDSNPTEELADQLDPAERYDLARFGTIYREDGEERCSFADAFSIWLRARDNATIAVAVPHGSVEEFRKFVLSIGGKVL